jgi:hypothetical protein
MSEFPVLFARFLDFCVMIISKYVVLVSRRPFYFWKPGPDKRYQEVSGAPGGLIISYFFVESVSSFHHRTTCIVYIVLCMYSIKLFIFAICFRAKYVSLGFYWPYSTTIQCESRLDFRLINIAYCNTHIFIFNIYYSQTLCVLSCQVMFIDHGNGHTQFPTKSSWSDASASFVAQQWWIDYKQGDNISFILQFLLSLDFMDHEHSSIPSFHKKEQ